MVRALGLCLTFAEASIGGGIYRRGPKPVSLKVLYLEPRLRVPEFDNAQTDARRN